MRRRDDSPEARLRSALTAMRHQALADLGSLALLVRHSNEVARAITEVVERHRANGVAWAHFGRVLGISKQAVHARFREKRDPPLSPPHPDELAAQEAAEAAPASVSPLKPGGSRE